MTPLSRAKVVSSFTVVKGALIDETYMAFKGWDLNRSKRENLDRFRAENPIGAKSVTWLRDVAKVLNRRFDPAARDRPLVQLAKNGCTLDEWKPLLLWHMTRDEFLVRDFLQNWLFPAYDKAAGRIRSEDVVPYLAGVDDRGAVTEHSWSEATTRRVSAGLLKIATDFGLLRGVTTKEFTTFHLPERSFIYLLHALREETTNPGRIIDSADWRMFLMRPSDVEAEILRLHQFQKVDYQVAGSIIQLSLPCASPVGYAERMVA
ncbi:BrxA family protein [Micromonospora sp. NPDC006431]|uniref:BrxA family protein n=1 Tax=Micromonospora sp. NPDC006431 TaxID=3364235 RepID=UPI0036C524BC